jgi:NDP-sugar pyrophosphorylase family protein
MKILKNDFILVSGDIVSNIDIHDALRMHCIAKEMES